MLQTMVSKIAIDCILSEGSDGLQGDGCIYALSSSPPSITGPEHLHPGDYVKLRLWLPDDESSAIQIDLAEVQWVKHQWIKLDLLLTSHKDQARLRQFITPTNEALPVPHRMWEQIVIRA
ncbi:MAG: hypothetical protein U0223_02580 [Nitrospira sp.]|nr:hypothetical protein [Nitrospira sp.]